MTRADWGSTDLGGTIGTLHAGAKLRVAHWQGAADGPGTVIIVQGRGEFIEMYGETVADLTDRGFAVIAFDFRGQGGSARRVRTGGHIDSYRHYVEDLAAVVRYAAQIGLPRPYTLLAHSMGGLVATLAIPQLAREIDRVVAVAPLFKIARLPVSPGLAAAVSHIGARLGMARSLITRPRGLPTMERFPGNLITSDPARYAHFCTLAAENPDLTIGPPTFGWLSATFSAMRQARRMADTLLAVPTLFVACGGDRVVSPVAIDSFARRVKGGGLVLMRGARHQLLYERDALRALFFAAFDSFVTANAPAPGKAGKRAAKPRRAAGRGLKFVVGTSGGGAPQRPPMPDAAAPAAPAEPVEAPATVAAIDPQPAVQAAPEAEPQDDAPETPIGEEAVAGRFDSLREQMDASRKPRARTEEAAGEDEDGKIEAPGTADADGAAVALDPEPPGPPASPPRERTRITPPPRPRKRGVRPARGR